MRGQELAGSYKMVKILIFGDSITWGAFDTEHGGWVERLKIYFFNQTSGPFHDVYNLGISSDDTRGLLFRLEKQMEIIEKIEPEEYIFIFSIGSNDCRYIKTKENKVVSINEFEENLKEIINLAKKYSYKIIFTGFTIIDESKIPPIPWGETEYYEKDDLEEYNNRLKKICEDNKLLFIPMWNVISFPDLDEDGLHLNSKGHEKIFEKVKEFLIKEKIVSC